LIGQRVSRWLLRATGWKMVGQAPASGILVGAPHTSNWDFVLMLLVMRSAGLSQLVLIKESLFWQPLGWFLRSCGGIPVERNNPTGLVMNLVARLRENQRQLLVIAPEGRRRKGEYWKSGFYHIATRAQLPMVLAFIDGPTRTVGFGPTLMPSGDVRADMDLLREFYADKQGLRPAWRTEPRLRDENRPVARPAARPVDDQPSS
jgi:1-acyl-sn-glycerol-3-phosphate acyltransferase